MFCESDIFEISIFRDANIFDNITNESSTNFFTIAGISHEDIQESSMFSLDSLKQQKTKIIIRGVKENDKYYKLIKRHFQYSIC